MKALIIKQGINNLKGDYWICYIWGLATMYALFAFFLFSPNIWSKIGNACLFAFDIIQFKLMFDRVNKLVESVQENERQT